MKIKNMKLMLLGLTAMGGVNAFADAGDMVKLDNLVYKVNADNKTVTFYGLTKSPTEGVGNTTTVISVPTEIPTKDAEGNDVKYKVTASMNKWFDAKDVDGDGTDDTQSVVSTIQKITFAKGIKLSQTNINLMFAANLTALTDLTIGQANIVSSIPVITKFTSLVNLDISGITNDGDPITIADNFAEGITTLETVKLPSKADITIGEFAFWKCSALKSVTLSGETNVIGASAFRGTSALKSIDLSKVTTIGEYAFSASGLTALTIPENVEAIDANAFYNNEALKTVTINSNKLTSVGEWFGVADGKTSIIETVVVNSSSITTIAPKAFVSTKLKDITLTGEKLKTITNAFPSTNADLENVDYSNTIVETLFDFGAAGSLKKYLFPATIKTFAAFTGYSKLETISAIPAGVTELPDAAFSGCTNLTAIDFTGATGLSLLKGSKTFYHCAKLGIINLSNTKIGAIPANAFEMAADYNADGITIKKYYTALTKVSLPDVTNLKNKKGEDLYATFTIGKEAFKHCGSLTVIENLNQAKLDLDAAVAQFAYSGLTGTIDLSAAVAKDASSNYYFTTIPSSAFQGCGAIEKVIIPEGVTSVEAAAFYLCGKLADVEYKNIENLANIKNQAFDGCALKEVDLSGAIGKKDDAFKFTTISAYAFANNKSLETVKLPANVSAIEVGAFMDDIALKSINLNETSITTLNNIFTSYTGTSPYDKEISLDKLTSLELVKSTELKDKDGKKIVLPEITEIADYALQFTGLKEIVIPESVKKMGTGAFRACTNLEKFTWKNVFGGEGSDPAITSLPNDCFKGDVKLTEVYFLTTKTSAVIKDKDVFFMCDKDLLTVYLTPDSYNRTVAEGYGNDNRQYSTLAVEGNKQFAFSEKGLASDGYYYATYYNLVNSSWFKTSEFDVFAAVVEGNKVVLKKATADGDYYKVAALTAGTNDKAAVCVVRSKNIDAIPELNSNEGSDKLTTLDDHNGLKYVKTDGAKKGSKLNYIFKLSNVKGNVAFYRVTSGEFKKGQICIEASTSAARLNIVVEGEGEITGIQDIFGEDAAQADAPVYNLQGARMNGTLQKGIYVKNGKKFIVK